MSTIQGGGKRRAVSPDAAPGCACSAGFIRSGNPLALIFSQVGTSMTRAFAAIILCGLAMGVAAFVIYRANSPRSPVQAAFYQDLAQADAVVDPAAAQSMISGYRSNNGLGRVVIDADLMRLASEQARAMAARGRMDQEVGSPFQDRMRKAGLGGSFAVENVGAGYHTLADAFSGWRDSPPHRANMLNRGVTRMGIAAAYAPASKYKVFWALIFAGSDGRRG